MGRPGPAVLVLDLDRAVGLGRAGRHAAGPGLERGQLVEAEHHLVRGQGTGQQVGDGPDLLRERRVTGGAGIWSRPPAR